MIDRRSFLKLGAVGGGAVFISGLSGPARAAQDDFYFVQLSDVHWGFSGAPNPDAQNTFRKAVATVNALETRPDFIIFTGDLTHTTDDPKEGMRASSCLRIGRCSTWCRSGIGRRATATRRWRC